MGLASLVFGARLPILIVCLIVVENEATLSIYSASVYPPDSPYTYLLSWNTLFDTVYSTFNTSGVVAIGGVLLAAGGKVPTSKTLLSLSLGPRSQIKLEEVKMWDV